MRVDIPTTDLFPGMPSRRTVFDASVVCPTVWLIDDLYMVNIAATNGRARLILGVVDDTQGKVENAAPATNCMVE